MTDSLKLAEMQRTSIEFERQRHLANWFIKSSPHMATPTSPPPVTTSAAATAAAATLNGANGVKTTNNLTTTNNISLCNNASTTAVTTTTIHLHQQQQQQHHNHNQPNHNPHHQQHHTPNNHNSTAKHLNNSSSNSSNAGGGGGGVCSSNNPNSNNTPGNSTNPVFFLMSSNGNTGAIGGGNAGCGGVSVNGGGGSVALCHPNAGKHNSSPCGGATGATSSSTAVTAMGGASVHALGHLHVEGRKPKLRRFNSHETSSNMFSVADFENARLARRNEIELKQRLQRRTRMCTNVGYGGSAMAGMSNSIGGDYSTGDSKLSKYSNESQHEPLPADIFLDRFSLPRVVRISYKTKFNDETLQSSSSNGSSTVTSSSSASGTGVVNLSNATNGNTTSTTGTSSSTTSSTGVNLISNNNNNNNNNNTSSSSNGSSKNITPTTSTTVINSTNSTNPQDQGELFLLYRLVRQRHIYHGHNSKTAAANRKKGVLIPQEFPGYFSLLNDKGLPLATLYTSLIQLVRERVFKFVSVDNLPAFTESQSNANNPPTAEGCLPIYTSTPSTNRPQYVKTTARGGQVFRLLAVFEDGKQDHNAIGGSSSLSAKPNGGHGREKEKGRYAQVLNENRQVLYVSLSTKGKFYEIEPGVPQILQKLGNMGYDPNKKVNPDCVHRIAALMTPNKELPITLRYISGPSGCANTIPENICITKITTENVVIACPIEDVEMQSPLHLRKLHLTKEMNLLKCSLGFESEQRMFANPNVQNILKFCQFNCDQFLKMVEIEILNRPERSGSKSRVDGLKILKPLHFPKLLRREKTTIPAHEKEDSIIFLSKNDLANLEAKEAAASASLDVAVSGGNRISEKMKVFQSTKKKWFRRQDKHSTNSLTSIDLDLHAKRMSMERYSDMSKLLQERFGDKQRSSSNEQESISEPSGASDIGCSDTETTTLATIEEKMQKFGTKLSEPILQKSLSLQDIELINGTRKPDLLPTLTRADTISEAGTDLEDIENRAPPQQSFITEKLYTEFHVKTRQYSKSSSSLHQLLSFSLPQKLQLHETKRTLAQLKQNQQNGSATKTEKRLDFNIGEPVTGRRAAGGLSLLASGIGGGGGGLSNSQNTSLISPLTPISLIEDDLPYSSVRDSLLFSSDESAAEQPHGNICQALHLLNYTKENIYAEICHDVNAMGGGGSGGSGSGSVGGCDGFTHIQTRNTFSGDTHSTQISDDYGDYASLTYPTSTAQQQQQHNNGVGAMSNGYGIISGGNAISRVHVNCTPSPVSYHTVYFGDEPLGEHYAERRRALREARDNGARYSLEARDRAHITTVELEGGTPTSTATSTIEAAVLATIPNMSIGTEAAAAAAMGADAGAGATALQGANSANLEGVDNIYNTLK